MRRFSMTQKSSLANNQNTQILCSNQFSPRSTVYINNYNSTHKNIKAQSQYQKSIQRYKSKTKNNSTSKFSFSKSKNKLSQLNSTQNLHKKMLFSQQLQFLQNQAKLLFQQINKILNYQNSFLAKQVKIRIKQWLKILSCIIYNQIWSQNRNLYLKVLLAMLESQLILQPFSTVPSDGPLPKLNISDIPYLIKDKMLKKYNLSQNQKSLKKRKSISINKRKPIQQDEISLKKYNSKNHNAQKSCKRSFFQSQHKQIYHFQDLNDQSGYQKENNFNQGNVQKSRNKMYRKDDQIKSKSLIKKLKSITFQDIDQDSQIKQQNIQKDEFFPDYLFQSDNIGLNNHNQYQVVKKSINKKECQMKEQRQRSKTSKLDKFLNQNNQNSQSKYKNMTLKQRIYTMKTDDQHIVSKNLKNQWQWNCNTTNIKKHDPQTKPNQQNYLDGYVILVRLRKYLIKNQKALINNQEYTLLVNKINSKVKQIEKTIKDKKKNSSQQKKQPSLYRFQQISCNLKQKISKAGQQTMEFLNFLGKYNSQNQANQYLN